MDVRWLLILICFLLSACASSREKAAALADQNGWQWETITAGKFDLTAAHPAGIKSETLWIYIEGDGFAFITPHHASSDPTPTDPIGLKLALADTYHAAKAYLARPCQYGRTDARNCSPQFWTSARYAPDVIASMNLAIDKLKTETGARRIVLSGYSGGGAVAVLAAARRDDVAGIITVAADLDIGYWTKRDGLTPLKGSLDPVASTEAVAKIPQIHFAGELDDTVGPEVVRSYINRLPPGTPARMIVIGGFTHKCCWSDDWSKLLALPDAKSIWEKF